MKSILEVSKEGITIHQIPLSDRVSVGSEEWKKIPDRSISSLDSNIQFRLIDGKNLMVYLLDKSSKITMKGKEHLGPKTILVPHNENVTVETGHSLKLSTDLTEDKKVFSKATIFKANLPGLKIDGMPVVFDSADDAVDIIESEDTNDEEFFADDIDEIQIEAALNEKVELNKLYYDDEDEIEEELKAKLPQSPPPVEDIKSDEERENEAVDEIVEISNEEVEDLDPNEVEIDLEEEYQDEEVDELETTEIEEDDSSDEIDVDFDETTDPGIDLGETNDPGIDIEESTEDEINTDDTTDPDIAMETQFDEMTDSAFQARTDITAEDIVIGDDFSEQVLEDLQNIEKQVKENKQEDPSVGTDEINDDEDNDDEETPKSTEELLAQFREENPLDPSDNEEYIEDVDYEGLATDPSKKENVEVPDDEEWEKIQAEMQDRLNPTAAVDNDSNPDKTDPGFAFEQSFEDDEEEDEEDLEEFIDNEESNSKPSLKEKLTGLFSRKKKSSAEIVFDPDAKEDFQEESFEGEEDEIDFDAKENSEPKKNFLSNFTQSFKSMIGNKMGKKRQNESHPEIVFDDSTQTKTSAKSDAPNLAIVEEEDDEDINYEELGFEKPEVSEIKEIKQEVTSKSNRFTAIAKIKNIFAKKEGQDLSESTDTNEIGEFKEFHGDETNPSIEDEFVEPEKVSLMDKIRNVFKKKGKGKDEEVDDDEFAEMTNAHIKAEEIAEAMDETFAKEDVEEEDEEDDDDEEKKEKKSSPLIKGKKGKKDLLKAAKKGKRAAGQDPKPGIVARTLSVVMTLFIVFNIYHFVKAEPQVTKSLTLIEQHFIKTKAPVQKTIYKIQQAIPKEIPATYRKHLTNFYNPEHLKYLYQKENQRIFIFYVLFELLCLILLGNSLPLFIMGARSENDPGKARVQAVIKFLLWPITILLPVLDFGLLINRRSFREVITKSYINYPNTSIRNIVLIIGFPVFLIAFFCWPYLTNLEVFSSREITVSKYNPVNESELEYSEVLDVSLKPSLKAGYVFIPAWEIGKKQQMQASLKIYSIKTDQQAYMRKYRPIDLPKILKQVTKYDPLFFRFHPKLQVFDNGKTSSATEENYQALNDFLLDCLSISAFDYKSLLKLYKTGPYINDDLKFKKLFLKHIDQIGIQKIIVHKNGNDKTLEIVPSRQAGVQTSYFLALSENQNTLYSLTYSKKATDTRKEITKLSLNQMSFTFKSSTPVSDPAIQTLDNLKQVVDPSYTEEEAFEKLFKYYYSLSKRAIESDKKKFIDLARKEVVKTGDLIGKLKQEPKLSQKYRERFRNLSRALETLDVRYFSL